MRQTPSIKGLETERRCNKSSTTDILTGKQIRKIVGEKSIKDTKWLKLMKDKVAVEMLTEFHRNYSRNSSKFK